MTEQRSHRYVRRWEDVYDDPGMAGRVRSWARRRALDVLARWPREEPGRQLRCLNCHWVFDDQKSGFREIMASLQQRAEFVDTETCLRMVRGEEPIDDTYLHLSFDDGFRNNVENAAPILCELEIPAVFFVTTDYMSSGWEGAREFARRSGRDGVVEMATWEQLRQLDARGFEIGAHTCTHRRLADLHRAEARSEILESKRAIEDEIDGECRYFSWPFGGRDDIRPEVIELVKSVGFEGCFSGCRGEVEPGSTDPFRIPRHHIQPHWPVSHVRYFAFRPPAGSVDGFA